MALILRITRIRTLASALRSAALLMAGLAMASPATLSAAELYKVIDEEGNVTFSQFPPSKAEGEVENVKLEGVNDAMTAISKTGHIEYCGDIELPNKEYYQSYDHPSDRFLRNVGNKRKSWQRQLERAEKQVDDSNRRKNMRNNSGYNNYYRNKSYQSQQDVAHYERQEAQLSQIRDLRCAINWADQRNSDMEQFREQNHTELKRLEVVQQNLLNKMHRDCGNEPLLDPSNQGATMRRDQWSECSKQYQRDLREVSRQLQKVSQKIGATLP